MSLDFFAVPKAAPLSPEAPSLCADVIQNSKGPPGIETGSASARVALATKVSFPRVEPVLQPQEPTVAKGPVAAELATLPPHIEPRRPAPLPQRSVLAEAYRPLGANLVPLPPEIPSLCMPPMPLPMTMAEVKERTVADGRLTTANRRAMISALAVLEQATGLSLADIPARERFIRDKIEGFAPAKLGLSEKRWRNVKSLVRAAMKQAGLPVLSPRSTTPLSDGWVVLLAPLNSKKRYGLSKLAQYCTEHNIEPDQIDDAVMARFLAHLEETLLDKVPREIHRTTCKLWEEFRPAVPGWPQQALTVPSYTKFYVLPLDTFLASFNADAGAHLEHLRAPDPLDEMADFDPLRPISLKTRRREIYEFASALVHRGRKPVDIRSLADLTTTENFKEGLRYFYEVRTPGKYLQAHRMACMLTTIAKHWVKVPEEQLKKMRAICKQLNKKPKGMSDKTRERLWQFDDPKNVAAFLTLPQTLIDEAEGKRKAKRKRPANARPPKKKTPRQKAMLWQTAAAIEILTMAPFRIKNLATIQMGVQLLPTGKTFRLCFEPEEVKNRQRLGPEVPEESAAVIKKYIEVHRPYFMGKASSYLFPSKRGGYKCLETLAAQICSAVKKYTGIELHVHAFRAIAAKIHLAAHPGDYGTVKLLHGHKNIQTTIDYYCESEQPAAHNLYDQHILFLRGQIRDGKVSVATSKKKST